MNENNNNKDKKLNNIENDAKEKKINREITNKEMEQIVGGAVVFRQPHKPRF